MQKHSHKRRRHPRHIHCAARRRTTAAAIPAAAEETPALPQGRPGSWKATAFPAPPSPRGDHKTEAATARLVLWAMDEEHRPARLVAARSAAERILSPQETPSPRRVAGRLTEEQTRELLLNALRGVCRRSAPMAILRQWIRQGLRALAALLGRTPSATLHPITIELE